MSAGLLRSVWLGSVPYLRAWEMQRALAAARREGRLADDVLLLLEHPPVYTMGRGGDPAHLPGGPDHLRRLGAEYHEVDRGGSVTFHGPGQLVGYPIVDLAATLPVEGSPGTGDVGAYLRALEAALCETARHFGVSANRRPPYTGAWVGGDKLAAIGVKLASGVTQHGVALNVTTDLGWFDAIVPCGISDGGVTSLERCGVRGLCPETVAPVFAAELAAVLGLRAATVEPLPLLLAAAAAA
jgi:lipoate-protein ligase B